MIYCNISCLFVVVVVMLEAAYNHLPFMYIHLVTYLVMITFVHHIIKELYNHV